MMRFINVSRKKDALILIGSILLIVMALGVQIALGRTAGNGGPGTNAAAVAAFFTSPDSLLNRIGAFFPPGIWATRAVAGGFTGEGLANLALLWGVSIGLVRRDGRCWPRCSSIGGVVGLGETTGKKRRLTRDEMSRRVSSGRRAVAAVFWREWKIMNRTPIFLLNGTLVVVLFPAIFVLMATIDTGGGGSGGSGGGDPMALLQGDDLGQPARRHPGHGAVHDDLRQHQRHVVVDVLAGGGAVLDLAGDPGRAAGAGGGQVPSFVPGGRAGRGHGGRRRRRSSCTSRRRIWRRRPGLSLVAGVLLTVVGMAIDLARPLLDWTNPQKAIKQNLNVLLAMLADIGILTIVFFGGQGADQGEAGDGRGARDPVRGPGGAWRRRATRPCSSSPTGATPPSNKERRWGQVYPLPTFG